MTPVDVLDDLIQFAIGHPGSLNKPGRLIEVLSPERRKILSELKSDEAKQMLTGLEKPTK